MHIGFDAKRAYQNDTGLGQYSRTLISSLAGYFPNNEYFLFAPKLTEKFNVTGNKNIHPIQPEHFPSNFFRSAWRSQWILKDIKNSKIDIYHGLSHEIPLHLRDTTTKSIVTIHDLIFERYPEQFNKIDAFIYRKKARHACANADNIIAISEQTKDDLIKLYNVPAEKITVCYQSCNPIFEIKKTSADKEIVRARYHLPEKYFLSVGSIIERKNLLTICKAMRIIKDKLPHPLVVIGKGNGYKLKVKKYITEHGLTNKVIFLSDTSASDHTTYKNSNDFPAIYQMATALIYPSIFEGFGLPVLEALWSGTPVITSNVSCMPETGGDSALYVSPFDEVGMAAQMFATATDEVLAEQLKAMGILQAQRFSRQTCATAVMNLYKKTCDAL